MPAEPCQPEQPPGYASAAASAQAKSCGRQLLEAAVCGGRAFRLVNAMGGSMHKHMCKHHGLPERCLVQNCWFPGEVKDLSAPQAPETAVGCPGLRCIRPNLRTCGVLQAARQKLLTRGTRAN